MSIISIVGAILYKILQKHWQGIKIVANITSYTELLDLLIFLWEEKPSHKSQNSDISNYTKCSFVLIEEFAVRFE